MKKSLIIMFLVLFCSQSLYASIFSFRLFRAKPNCTQQTKVEEEEADIFDLYGEDVDPIPVERGEEVLSQEVLEFVKKIRLEQIEEYNRANKIREGYQKRLKERLKKEYEIRQKRHKRYPNY